MAGYQERRRDPARGTLGNVVRPGPGDSPSLGIPGGAEPRFPAAPALLGCRGREGAGRGGAGKGGGAAGPAPKRPQSGPRAGPRGGGAGPGPSCGKKNRGSAARGRCAKQKCFKKRSVTLIGTRFIAGFISDKFLEAIKPQNKTAAQRGTAPARHVLKNHCRV